MSKHKRTGVNIFDSVSRLEELEAEGWELVTVDGPFAYWKREEVKDCEPEESPLGNIDWQKIYPTIKEDAPWIQPQPYTVPIPNTWPNRPYEIWCGDSDGQITVVNNYYGVDNDGSTKAVEKQKLSI